MEALTELDRKGGMWLGCVWEAGVGVVGQGKSYGQPCKFHKNRVSERVLQGKAVTL